MREGMDSKFDGVAQTEWELIWATFIADTLCAPQTISNNIADQDGTVHYSTVQGSMVQYTTAQHIIVQYSSV